MFNEIKFAIEGDPKGKVFKGKDVGQRWNGWLVPLVTDVVHNEIVKWMEEEAAIREDASGDYELIEEMKNARPHYGMHTHYFGLCWAIID